MIDIKFLRENPDVVKENIKKKFQDEKLPLVDEVIALDAESRKAKQEGDDLRASRNKISKEIGGLMAQGKKEEAEAKKAEVAAGAKRLAELEVLEAELQEKITKIMMVIPNIIDPSVPIGKDDRRKSASGCSSFRTSLTRLCRLARMTARTWKLRNSVTPLFLILKYPTMQIFWTASAVWIRMLQAAPVETVSII